MLSRAQEARVRDVLANRPPGTIQAYCLEHLAAAVKIPPGHLADLAVFIRSLREHAACQTQYGGICDEIGRAHVSTPVTPISRMPTSACKNKKIRPDPIPDHYPTTSDTS